LAVDWCTITSPIDGVVVQLLARQGQFLDRAVSLATVIDLTEVFVQIRVPSRQFTSVQADSKIDIQLTSLPGKTIPGQITRISGQADPATGNVNVFATVHNKTHLLRPGLNCKVRIALPEIPNALCIPVKAVADRSGVPVVTVIRNGKAFETEVQTGMEAQELVQILQGISANDIVATAGGYGLPDGTPVTVNGDSTADPSL
jgi:RND family efflux transporter MFP subunit